MTQKIKVRIVTGAWGDWHIAALLDVNLPSLMAPGNIEPFLEVCEPIFQFYTLPADVERLSHAPAVTRLAARCPVDITLMPQDSLHDPIGAHKQPWFLGMEEAKRDDCYVMFFHPDVAWADGSFRHLAGLLRQGRKAVFMTFLRTVSDTFVPALLQRAHADGAVIAVPPRDMVELSLRHLHPLMAAYFHDSPFFPYHAEMMLWPVRGEGVHVRVLAREMFLFHPNRIAMTEQLLLAPGYDPKDVEMIADSDDLYAVSLARLGKDLGWHDAPARAEAVDIGQWLLTFESPANDFVASAPLRWHKATPTEWRWRRAERASALFLAKAQAAREALRVWRSLVYLNAAFTAASVLSFALQNELAGKAFPRRPDGTILILAPSDATLSGRLPGIMAVLAEGREAELIALLRHHAVALAGSPASLEAALDAAGGTCELVSLAGRRLTARRAGDELLVDGARVLPPFGHRPTGYLVYTIETILDPAFAA